MTVIELNQLVFRWKGRREAALSIPQLSVTQGEHAFIRGESGSGKTTLLNLLTGILQPQQGELRILGQPIHQMSPHARDRFRAEHMGVIFQQFNLLPYLSLVDNVLLPCHFSKRRREQAMPDPRTAALKLLDHLNLEPSLQQNTVNELSVGQQQRVAVARALIGRPELIIADEPTSALDTQTRDDFIALLFQEAETQGSTILFVSHDPYIASHFPRIIELSEINEVNPA